jgi:hypothetical protein
MFSNVSRNGKQNLSKETFQAIELFSFFQLQPPKQIALTHSPDKSNSVSRIDLTNNT